MIGQMVEDNGMKTMREIISILNEDYENDPEYAVEIAKELRDISRHISDVAWELDAAISAVRKDSVGYRTHNAANFDGGRNAKPGQLNIALRKAKAILKRINN